MAFGDDAWNKKLNREILGQNVDRLINHGELRPHERARAIDIAQEAFHGNVSNGEATDIAKRIITSGR